MSRRARTAEPWFWTSIAALVALAAYQHWPGLGPSSLYLDDQWVAALVERSTLWQLLASPAPTPHGFRILLRLAHSIFNDKSWALQAVPFAAALALVPAAAAMTRAATASPPIGVIAAVLAASSPMLAEYSIRVKQYPTDALATTIVLWLAHRDILQRQASSSWHLALGGIACVLLSFPALLFASLALTLSFARQRQDSRRAHVSRGLAWIVFHILLLAIAVWLIRPQSSPAMRDFWKGYFLPTADFSATVAFLRTRGLAVAISPFSWSWLALLVPVGLLAEARDPDTRPMAWFHALSLVALATLSALGQYPLGGGRTDLFLLPLLLLLAATAARLMPARQLSQTGLAATGVVLTLTFPGPRTAYPYDDDAFAALSLCATARPEDAVVVYPHTTFVVATHCAWPARFVPSRSFAHNFQIRFERPHTLVLPEEDAHAISYQQAPSVVDAALTRFLESGRHPRLHFVVTSSRAHIERHIVAMIEGRGYLRAREHRLPSGSVHWIFLPRKPGQ